MTQFYPPGDHNGPLLYVIRLVAGSAWVLFICLGFAAIRRRDIARHRAWMMRGYAIGLGAGTQSLTLGNWFLIVGASPGELSRAPAHGGRLGDKPRRSRMARPQAASLSKPAKGTKGHDPGTGKPMKNRVIIPDSRKETWIDLCEESRQHMTQSK